MPNMRQDGLRAHSAKTGSLTAESTFSRCRRAPVRIGGNRAFYSIAADVIQMPPFESFQDADSYYATLAHECTHWAGSKTRLDRDFGGHRFGSEGYAVEELVAELGAAFLCADLELALEPREDHASYIATWLKVLAADHRAVFTAAAHAQRAAEFINRSATEAVQQTAVVILGASSPEEA